MFASCTQLVGINWMAASSNLICARYRFRASRDGPPNRHRHAGGRCRVPLWLRRTLGRPNLPRPRRTGPVGFGEWGTMPSKRRNAPGFDIPSPGRALNALCKRRIVAARSHSSAPRSSRNVRVAACACRPIRSQRYANRYIDRQISNDDVTSTRALGSEPPCGVARWSPPALTSGGWVPYMGISAWQPADQRRGAKKSHQRNGHYGADPRRQFHASKCIFSKLSTIHVRCS
jgi:hypothetical protein